MSGLSPPNQYELVSVTLAHFPQWTSHMIDRVQASTGVHIGIAMNEPWRVAASTRVSRPPRAYLLMAVVPTRWKKSWHVPPQADPVCVRVTLGVRIGVGVMVRGGGGPGHRFSALFMATMISSTVI